MARTLKSVPPTPTRHRDLTPEQFVTEVYRRLESNNRRAVDYYRKSELTPPFSKTWIDDRLKDGALRYVKLLGLTLITGESLRALLASAEPWEPR